MSLGLLAKDSIQDFSLLLKEKDDTDSTCDGLSPQLSPEHDGTSEHLIPTEPIADGGDDCETNEPEPLAKTPEELGDGEGSRTTAANPQQAHDENGDQGPHTTQNSNDNSTKQAQYAGFKTAYHFESQKDSVGLDNCSEANFSVQQHNAFFPNLIRCLFPWVFPEKDQETTETTSKPQEEYREYEVNTNDQTHKTLKTDGSQSKKGKSEEDEQSANSEALGEKLSRKDRQAVLARLGLAEPDAETKILKEKKGLLNGIPTYDTSPLESVEDSFESGGSGIRGILKRASTKDLSNAKKIESDASSVTSKNTSRRRSLFPQYDTARKAGKKPPVTFAPMARVITVKSKNEMTQEEKADIWWQKSDYENFRKTGRMITKAIMEGGSQIWLSSQNPKDSSTTATPLDSGDTVGQEGDKWWHKFGHSRRGLEHVVSVQEGRERQINVRNAIRSVVEEHARQKAYKREDPEKLRIVALNLTSWARDLALAAGSSDADAVSSSFAANRKSREFYLLKMTRGKQNTSGSIPGFMQPLHPGSPPKAVASALSAPRQQQRLDANTSAQIRFRQHRRLSSLSTPNAEDKETTEPVKDQNQAQKGESLAHRAAGFLVDGEKVDASGVLAGMGVLAKEPAAVAT